MYLLKELNPEDQRCSLKQWFNFSSRMQLIGWHLWDKLKIAPQNVSCILWLKHSWEMSFLNQCLVPVHLLADWCVSEIFSLQMINRKKSSNHLVHTLTLYVIIWFQNLKWRTRLKKEVNQSPPLLILTFFQFSLYIY